MEQLTATLCTDQSRYDGHALASAVSARPQAASRLACRLDRLSRISASTTGVTRLYLTPEHRRAADIVAAWMRDAGMMTTIDAVGNVVGRYEGKSSAAKSLVIGSHLDTGADAGPHDGSIGILLAIEAVDRLNSTHTRLPFAVEVVAFGGKDTARFPRRSIGSSAIAGELEIDTFDVVDAEGISLREALTTFGCQLNDIKSLARRPEHLLGYVELHVEHGPILDSEALPVGVVTAINGINHFAVSLTGTAANASTLPMAMRRDALCGAAEMVLAVEDIARRKPGLVATVTRVLSGPGIPNAVPAQVEFAIEIRSAVDRLRRDAVTRLTKQLKDIARRRALKLQITETHEQRAVPCDAELTRTFADAIDSLGIRVACLPSGQSHDALAMARLCPIGILFVRSRNAGSSWMSGCADAADIEVAADVLIEALERLALPRLQSAA